MTSAHKDTMKQRSLWNASASFSKKVGSERSTEILFTSTGQRGQQINWYTSDEIHLHINESADTLLSYLFLRLNKELTSKIIRAMDRSRCKNTAAWMNSSGSQSI